MVCATASREGSSASSGRAASLSPPLPSMPYATARSSAIARRARPGRRKRPAARPRGRGDAESTSTAGGQATACSLRSLRQPVALEQRDQCPRPRLELGATGAPQRAERQLLLARSDAGNLEAEAGGPAHDRALEALAVVAQEQAQDERVGEIDPRQLGRSSKRDVGIAGRERALEASVWPALGGHSNRCSHARAKKG